MWRRVLLISLASLAGFLIALQILILRATPILKGRIVETLSTRFNSRVELDQLQVSAFPRLNVSGGGLRIFPPADVVAAGATHPLIEIGEFGFHAGIFGLMFKPTHVGSVQVRGLTIHIPPKAQRQQGSSRPAHSGKTKIEVDEILCEHSRLIIGTDKPNKDPKVFELQHIVLHDVGPNAPWPYDATLTNAVPRGDIHATGSFGPWNTETPGDSSVTGNYLFDHADLNTIKGIGGMLHSVGSFNGQLDRISVQGTADVPNFSLDTANHPVPLHTRFSAIVDGTSGDTYLQPVEAQLASSRFTCRGAVINIKGKGHQIDLDVDVPEGHVQDFLELSVKTQPAVMTGIIQTKTKLAIHPGKQSVTQKLSMQGTFSLRQIHFTSPAIQDKVDMLSLRAQARPREAKPGAADVPSLMNGRFDMSNGSLTFRNLDYSLPGANVQLAGVYSLDGKKFEFTGKVRTKATLSQMIASRWKSLLLKPVDPIFRKNGAGTEIPVKISGTKDSPHFGLNLFGKDKTSGSD